MESRMDTMLATNGDAQLILKLYELRTETGMRAARKWITAEFWPETARDLLKVLRAYGSQENSYLRQVLSYWEMAAAFVLHGALDGDLFLACNGESIFLLAKFHPFIEEIRAEVPGFLARTEELTLRFAAAKHQLDRSLKAQEARRAQQNQTSTAG